MDMTNTNTEEAVCMLTLKLSTFEITSFQGAKTYARQSARHEVHIDVWLSPKKYRTAFLTA